MAKFQSKLAKVKGWGSAHNGTEHFIRQRASSVAMLLLSIWLVWSFIYVARAPADRLAAFITSPFNITAGILFIACFLWHGMQGLQVVIEDYVHCKALKYSMLFVLNFVCVATFVVSVVAILDVRNLIN